LGDGVPTAFKADLVVDGLFGTGLSRPINGHAAELVKAVNASGVPVLSLDVPSGIKSDTGQVMGVAVRATATIEFIARKRFGCTPMGADHAGALLHDDLGATVPPLSACVTPPPVFRARERDAHKGSTGHVLVVAGSERYHGAAVLAALGALRGGAGLVTVASVGGVVSNVRTAIPEALVMPLPSLYGVIAPQAADTLREGTWSSVVVGPGLGQADRFMTALLEKEWPFRTCFDADALNVVARLALQISFGAVITPHPGEAARLLGCSTNEVTVDRFGSVIALQEKFGCAVVLKGASTLTAVPGHPVMVNPTGNPGMATGGMGDVLAGLVGALSHSPVADAVYLHGLAGDLCAEEIGPYGYTASELAARIPKARAKLMPCSA
jgi:NAD(P)H-hydrate epimerase